MYTANSINPLFTSLVFLRMLCWKINHFPTSFACWDAYLARTSQLAIFLYPIAHAYYSNYISITIPFKITEIQILYPIIYIPVIIPMKSKEMLGICSHLSVSSLRLFTLAPRRLPERPHIGPKLPTRPKGRTQEGPKSDQKWGVWVEFKHQTCGFYMDFNGLYIYIYIHTIFIWILSNSKHQTWGS